LRVSIITGGGSGIGAAVARRMAGPDQCLMLHGQGEDAAGLARLQAVASDCERAGARVAARSGDLANPGVASELVSAAREASDASTRSFTRQALPIGEASRNCRA
jgi:NAD(P)-dependent dehydrogenase (short-subunit alcohol dehydrogenase family)